MRKEFDENGVQTEDSMSALDWLDCKMNELPEDDVDEARLQALSAFAAYVTRTSAERSGELDMAMAMLNEASERIGW